MSEKEETFRGSLVICLKKGKKEREKSVQAAVGLLNILALANMLLKNNFC